MTPPSLKDRIEITRDVIDNRAIAREVRADEDGAVATFDGCVRNHSHGRTTLYLEYEAYESMALSKMQEIAAEIHAKHGVNRIAIVHRLGRLEIGETSVFIAVSAAHRAAAFDACRYAIDTLKKTVPIWKKEFFADGAAWADGELPPVPRSNIPRTAGEGAETPGAKPASK
jgi:molybdopterin synthase catalytic subunit